MSVKLQTLCLKLLAYSEQVCKFFWHLPFFLYSVSVDNNSINETVISVTFAEQDWAVVSNAGGNTCQAISPVQMQCNDCPGVSLMAVMVMIEIIIYRNCQTV